MSVRLVDQDRPDTQPIHVNRLMADCRAGREPAEILPTYAREWLIHDFWALGWTDVEIAVHTRTTTYTVARIRERLELCARAPIETDAV